MGCKKRKPNPLLSTFLLGLMIFPSQPLTPSAREDMRYRLQNLLNEAELLIKNKSVDAAEVSHQDKLIEQFKVYKRIPTNPDIAGLRSQLAISAKKNQLKLQSIDITSPLKKPNPVPKQVITDQEPFFLTPKDCAGEIRVKLIVRGDMDRIQAWIKEWPNEDNRIVELQSAPKALTALAGNKTKDWVIYARSFYFFKLQFPKLLICDPISLLPKWARRDGTTTLKKFAVLEPILWDLATRARDLIPEAEPLYEVKRSFFLNQARLGFFFSLLLKP